MNAAFRQETALSMDESASPSISGKEERTIPFLRYLTDMLVNNRNHKIISFVPGERAPSRRTPGKIIIHDRKRVQAEILPIYFNHASFASLRRQLSYFCFVRVGKSRYGGVTYVNDAVVELTDILKLKRRSGRQETAGHEQGGSVLFCGSSPSAEATLGWDVEDTNQNAVATTVTISDSRTASISTGRSSSMSSVFGSMEKDDHSGQMKRSNHPTISHNSHRLERLLYTNKIVPFIHLPSRIHKLTTLRVACNNGALEAPIMHESATMPVDSQICPEVTTQLNLQKSFMKETSSDSAVGALLSLGVQN